MLTENGPRTDVTDVTTYAYYTCTTGNECGQLQTITNAPQVTTFNTYNAHGQPLTITDPNDVVTTLTYDSRQRLASRHVGSEATTFDYWPTGLLKKVTLPDFYLLYTYDNAHRLTRIDDGGGNYIVYTLDAMGNRTAENVYDPTNFLTRTHSRVFNSLNQLWKDLTAAGTVAQTTVFGYDGNGNQTTINAPLTRNTTNVYDELNRLKQVTDPANGITQFAYDANDNLTSVTDPRTKSRATPYNGFGDLKTQTSPDTGVTTNTYDSGGNLMTSTDARSAITTYTLDALNRVTSAAYKIGSTTDQTITFTYDAGTNGKGRLTGASDANHSMSWVYDAQGRVTSKGQTVGDGEQDRRLRLHQRQPDLDDDALGPVGGLRLQQQSPGHEHHGQRHDAALLRALRAVRPGARLDLGQRNARGADVRHRRQDHADRQRGSQDLRLRRCVPDHRHHRHGDAGEFVHLRL